MGDREVEAALREAFLAGVRVGQQLRGARKLSTATGRAVGFRSVSFAPLKDPPTSTTYTQEILSSPDPDPTSDLRSIERAALDARETLELFPSAAPSPARSRARPKTSWPEDFELTEARAAYATRQGLDAKYEWGKFRAHALQDDRRHCNWDQAWHYWVRNAWELAGRR